MSTLRVSRILFAFISVAIAASATSTQARDPKKADCWRFLVELQYQLSLNINEPYVLNAHGSPVALSKAFEKEGLMYVDIADWFPDIDPAKFKEKLTKKLKWEKRRKIHGAATKWLSQFHPQYRDVEYFKYQPRNPDIELEKIIELLTKNSETINPFRLINMEGKNELFYTGLLSFDDMLSATDGSTPPFLTVGDDLGSYEVRSKEGTADLREYEKERDLVESQLAEKDGTGGKIGHQHTVHDWPRDDKLRADMAPYYMEMIDSITWWLFWRQAMRDNDEASSIIGHPYLGVYTRHSLDRLHTAVVSNDKKRFNNKFRMLGSRRLKGNPKVPGQNKDEFYPDLEARSGNKGRARKFMENLLISRISTGDYSGLKDFRSYDFNMDIPIHKMAEKYLRPHEVAWIQRMEEAFPPMGYKKDKRAHNHFRNKIAAPFFAFENRLNLESKKELIEEQRREYAQKLAEIARDYLNEYQGWKTTHDKTEGQTELFGDIETAIYEFSAHVRFDADFERYLKPVFKDKLPSILVKSGSFVNVNQVALGDEFSFRFPMKVNSMEEAEIFILKVGERLQEHFSGGSFEKLSSDTNAHGHGISLRYVFTDPEGKKWRVEWDGILRSYRNGKAYHARRGHIEVPSPKFAPQNTDDIEKLYAAMRSIEAIPKASAGGSHMNTDLGWLKDLSEEMGTEKFLNLVRYFESIRVMTAFLWQHPSRVRTSIPIDLSKDDIRRLNEFKGDWKALGKMLYQIKYFNTYVHRKPGYVQYNVVGFMSDQVAEAYQDTIDIKNPEQEWFPSFGGKSSDRGEFRLFDAAENEYLAALQFKYTRALLNRAWNTNGPVLLTPMFHPEHKELWLKDSKVFYADARKHLSELGLDFDEFKPLLVLALHNQRHVPFRDWKDEEEYQNFKPPVTYVEGMPKGEERPNR